MTDNRTTELLPCPFCGGSVSVCVCIGDWYDENDEIDGDSYEWIIRHNDFHSKCDLRSFYVSGIYRTLDCAEANEQKQRLIAAWNTRAELGNGTLTAEQVRKAVNSHGNIMDNRLYENWQAVADELNAVLGNGECRITASSTDGLTSDEPRHWFRLSCGHSFTVDGLDAPVACPVCGKAVKL